ncbi:SixA phosphatase family protein [Niabella drilacis]|uniref:Phosphohistidine phosphatase n=1 Tax=Niabella drilacis (strain DSM 25811 / CCM 8410 / CCUG 62505 / LMG 26954 / E90) TaxID=1285928 RepID=A0A1G6PXE4_NIADE|nr:histidine phosphatase family protein [Niabella drilacis]SDC84769.1 phosphohistidine phosphatase [Niabella drilacis]
MKTLIIIRHAKAEQGFGKDIERKLTDRGQRNAAKMAALLKEKGYRIDRIFSSNSERTMQTTRIFAEVLRIPGSHIRYFESLYLADVLGITETIEWLREGENIQTLAIVGHNPGVTNFVNDLTHAGLEGLPTSGVAVMEVVMDDWSNFDAAEKRLVETFSPKD